MSKKWLLANVEVPRTFNARIVFSLLLILLATNLLRVEELSVGAESDLVNDSGLQVHKYGPGYMLPRPSLIEKCRVGVIPCNLLFLLRSFNNKSATETFPNISLNGSAENLLCILRDISYLTAERLLQRHKFK